jgi:hypothetical protein
MLVEKRISPLRCSQIALAASVEMTVPFDGQKRFLRWAEEDSELFGAFFKAYH